MNNECDKCGEHALDCICKEFVYLIPFKEDKMICPECMKTYPKLRLPLLTICVDCPNEETRRKNREFKERLSKAQPKPLTPP